MILFWRGIWHLADITPYLAHPVTSLVVGVVLLAATGLFVLQLVGTAALQEQISDLKTLEEHIEVEEQELASVESRLEREVEVAVQSRARQDAERRAAIDSTPS